MSITQRLGKKTIYGWTLTNDQGVWTVELTNMIFGQARKESEDIGKVFHGAIPSVITGKNHKLIPMTKGHKIAIPFNTDSGSFTIEVALEG